jgi:type IX secretion system PorP/SprF family membrane protein
MLVRNEIKIKIMKIKIYTTILIGMLSLSAFAQQDAGFSMYFFNPVYINPGYAGSRGLLSGTIVHRSQWIDMPGAPVTQSLSIHSAVPNTNVGLGLQVYNDNAGPLKNTGISLTYAYHLPVGEKSKLSFGLTGMINNIRVGWDQINIDDKNDLAFVSNAASSWVPDASLGLYYYKERFYAGLSVNHLLQSRFNLATAPDANLAKFYRQYYLTSGIVIPLTKDLDFRPSVLLKYVHSAPVVGEIDASLIIFKKLFIGAGFRTNNRLNISGTDNMLVGIMEVEITDFLRLGYSYDYYLNRNGSYNSGTHEFMLGFDISGIKTKLSSPRFF